MGTLDGLMEAVMLVLPTYSPATKKLVNSAFDAYEREHPGLEDWTIKCCRCGKPGRPHDPRWLYDQAVIERPIPLEKAHVCQDCERPGDIRDD